MDLDTTYVEPLIPATNWLLLMCRNWFKVHEMKHICKLQKLRDVTTNLNRNNEAPPNISELTTYSSEDINHCVGSRISMVAMVMIRKVSPIATS